MRSILFTLILFISHIGISQYYTSIQLKTIDSTKTASEGDLYLDTNNNEYYIGLTHGKLGKLFPYGTQTSSITGVCDLLKPNLDNMVVKTDINYTQTIILTGYNFRGSSLAVSIGGVTVNSINVIGGTSIEVNITTGSTPDTTDIIVSNSCGADTIKNGMQILLSTWKDLRAGGDPFTSGNGAGNDIRYRAGMNMVRNANGMYFTGQNPWNSWVKFESCQYTRGTGTKVEFIMRVDGAMMIGISGLTTNEGSTTQYIEGAVLAYFSSSTNLWGLYGSSPTNGTTWNQANGATVNNAAILKIKIENDGFAGERITLYELPSAAPADWNDESNVISTIISTNGNTQTTLVPFIVPRSSTTNYFVALRVL